MDLVAKAQQYAVHFHKNMKRKGTRVPYLHHLLGVCKLLAERDCREELLAGALLHDIVEDTAFTLQEVEEEFGLAVMLMVKGATEGLKLPQVDIDKKATWNLRKEAMVEFVRNEASRDQLLIILADKVDNLKSTAEDIKREGERVVWRRFNAEKVQQRWYYLSLLEAFDERREDFASTVYWDLINELRRWVQEVF
jgi:myo-inositol-1(or 4)-monophosphatase